MIVIMIKQKKSHKKGASKTRLKRTKIANNNRNKCGSCEKEGHAVPLLTSERSHCSCRDFNQHQLPTHQPVCWNAGPGLMYQELYPGPLWMGTLSLYHLCTQRKVFKGDLKSKNHSGFKISDLALRYADCSKD